MFWYDPINFKPGYCSCTWVKSLLQILGNIKNVWNISLLVLLKLHGHLMKIMWSGKINSKTVKPCVQQSTHLWHLCLNNIEQSKISNNFIIIYSSACYCRHSYKSSLTSSHKLNHKWTFLELLLSWTDWLSQLFLSSRSSLLSLKMKIQWTMTS